MRLDSQRGLGIVEAIVAIGIFGVVAAGMATFFRQSFASAGVVVAAGDYDLLFSNVNAILANDAACANTIGNIDFTAPGPQDVPIETAGGGVFLTKNSTVGALKLDAVQAFPGANLGKGLHMVQLQTQATRAAGEGGPKHTYTDNYYVNVLVSGTAKRCLFGSTAGWTYLGSQTVFIAAPDEINAQTSLMIASSKQDANPEPDFGTVVPIASATSCCSVEAAFRHTQNVTAKGNRWILHARGDAQAITRGTMSPDGAVFALPNNQTFMPFGWTCARLLVDVVKGATAIVSGIRSADVCNGWKNGASIATRIDGIVPGGTYTLKGTLQRNIQSSAVANNMVSTQGLWVTVDEYLAFD